MVAINGEMQIKNAPTRVLLQTAQDIVTDIADNTTVFDDDKLSKVTAFSHDEIVTGRIIGRGGFCTIKEITSIKSENKKRSTMMFAQRRKSGSRLSLRKSTPKTQQETIMDMSQNGVEMSVKEYMAYAATRGGRTKYVVKQVADEWIYQNRITFLKATVDLAIEAKYLSALAHHHIIELRGVSQSGPFAEGYFLILDKLVDTLPGKLKKWNTIDRQCKGITGAFVGGKKKESALFVNRMEAAFGVANALDYIHSMNIVYRDLVSASTNSALTASCFESFCITTTNRVYFFLSRNPTTLVSTLWEKSRSLISV
jgi:serine/threonine protein kinase